MMEDFFNAYNLQVTRIIAVTAAVLLLRFLTNQLHKWFVKKEYQRFPEDKPTSINLVKRILNTLWVVLGIICLSSLFVERDQETLIFDNIKLVFYLGMVAVSTIVTAASVNMWFKQSVTRKIINQEDPTSYKFLRYVSVFVIYFTGTLFGLLIFPSLRGVAQTALGGAGIIAIVAGIASQEALSNIIGGLFIITFKPFKIGDIIRLSDGMVGTVADITLRHTVIRNFENKMIVIPNSIMNKEKLINFDLGDRKCCEHIEMGISYDCNVKEAKKIMQEVCENHPLIIDHRSEIELKDGSPMVKTALIKINDSTLTIRAWAWSKDFLDSFQLRLDVNESIKDLIPQE
jgi:small conductance mechanosensitive channel